MSRHVSMVFGCTALVGTNKVGTLKADENGYYEMVLGALDFNNSIGQIYPEAPAQELFKRSSGFMRRVANGYCRGEYGHPKKVPGMTMHDFMNRILVIEETRISHHIKDVWVDKSKVLVDGRPVLAIMGKVKPAGPYGNALRESLQNVDENVAFSIRSITDDYRINGKTQKHLREIVCWDFVNEPGISVANKFKAPSLESFAEDFSISEELLRNMAEDSATFGIGCEARDVIKSILHNSERARKIQIVGSAPSALWMKK